MALNSFENRVYDVELEGEEPVPAGPRNLSASRRVIKFYRPGRWSREQIPLEEHEFLHDLVARRRYPAIAPLPFEDGSTLRALDPERDLVRDFPESGWPLAR